MRKNYLLFLLAAVLTFSVKAQNVFDDNYAAGITFVDFGGAINSLSIDATTAHSGTSSLKAEVPNSSYTGGAFSSSTIKNLSTYNCVSFWVKSSAAKTLNVAGICNNGISAVWQTEYLNIPVTTTWTKVIIPIPNPSKDTAETGMFHWAEGSDEGAYTLWFDDIKYERLSGAIIGTPTASFGSGTISNYVGDNFYPFGATCSFPVNGVPQTLNIVNRWLTFSTSNNTVARVDGTATGTSLSVGSAVISAKLGSVIAGGALTVNVAAAVLPTVAAPTPPSRNAGDVISLFSGAYADLAVTDWFPNWGQSTVVTEVSIAGNPTKKYANFNYQGVQFSGHIDASTMTKLHIDLWTPDGDSIDVYPIADPNLNEQFVTLRPTKLGWNSFDIDLTNYTIPLNNLQQFKFVSHPFGGTNFWLDNIYFYKGTSTCCVAPTALKASPATITATTAKLKWTASVCSPGLGYQVQYRPVSSGIWKTTTTATVTKSLKGLTAATQYQWQVATICQASPLVISAYTTGPNFTTLTAAQNAIVENSDVQVVGSFTAGIAPNPANSSAVLRMNNTAPVNIAVADLSGKMLWQKQNVKEQQVSIPAEKFAPGIYMVTISNGKETKVIKLVKQ